MKDRVVIAAKLLKEQMNKKGCNILFQKPYKPVDGIILKFDTNGKEIDNIKLPCNFRMEKGIGVVEFLLYNTNN